MSDQIEEVKGKTDIVDLIGSYIELKKAGRNFKALCPFHGEKTPSFMISPELQTFKCFGCGEGGDAFTFLQKYEGMEFGETLKFLADRAGVKLKPLSFKTRSDKERIYEINALAAKFYHYILTKHKAGAEAVDYLKTTRGIDEASIETFQLGFSPSHPFAAKKFLVEKHKIAIAELTKAGLVYKSERGVFDRFRGRVIFPLNDNRGNVVGFAGRILPKDEKKDLAKYINTPETPVYHKGNLLYGLHLTKGEIKRTGEAVVVEGELDLISSYCAGVKNVVALKGTAITEEQVRLLTRLAKRIVMALDADLAGDAAARRGITVAQNQGLEIGVARLTGFKDPDEAARRDPSGFKKSIKNSVGVWDFIIDSIFAREKSMTGEAKARIGREIVPLLAQIKDQILQAHYAKVVGERLDVPTDSVISQIEQFSTSKKLVVESEVDKQGTQAKQRRVLLEERLFALSIYTDPDFLSKIDSEIFFTTPFVRRLLAQYLTFGKTRKKFNLSSFAKVLPPELRDGFNELVLRESEDNPDALGKELEEVKRELVVMGLKEKLNDLTIKIKLYEKKGDKQLLDKSQKAFAKYSGELTSIEQS